MLIIFLLLSIKKRMDNGKISFNDNCHKINRCKQREKREISLISNILLIYLIYLIYFSKKTCKNKDIDISLTAALKLSIKGEANVSWERRTTKDSQGRSRTQIDHFRASELYFNLTYYLLGNTAGNTHKVNLLRIGQPSDSLQYLQKNITMK